MPSAEKLSNLAVSSIDKVSGEADIAAVSGVDFVGSPTVLRLNIANNGDSWDPVVRMYSGTGTIDWGDGTPTEAVTTAGLSPHTYATSGNYFVTVTPTAGSQTRLLGLSSFDPDDTQVTEVMAFGDCGRAEFRKWTALVTIPNLGHLDLANLSVPFWSANLFRECSSFAGPTTLDSYTSNLGPAVSMSSSFFEATTFNRAGLGQLDTSAVTNFGGCFRDSPLTVSGPELWDTSSGQLFFGMFQDAAFFNRDLGGYNMSNATNISNMFYGATRFNNGGVTGVNQGLDTWNTSLVSDFFGVFSGAEDFNCRLDNWDVSGTTSLTDVFRDCLDFNNGGVSGAGLGIDNWNVSGVTDFSSMFYNAGSNTTSDIYLGSWNTASATDMNDMFRLSLKVVGLGGWSVGNVQDFSGMFYQNAGFNDDIGSWNTASATDMSNMFRQCTSFNNGIPGQSGNNGGVGIGIDNWNTSLVTDMSHMFRVATRFSWYIGSWDVSNVDNMEFMFSQAYDLFVQVPGSTLGIENWNTGNVTNMEEMFSGVVDVPIAAINGNWDFRKVTNLKNFCWNPNAALPDAQLDALVDAELALLGMNGANIQTTLVGWANYVNTNTGVNAPNLFGSISMSQSFFSAGKAAYDTLTAPVSSGGKGWTITGITWTP